MSETPATAPAEPARPHAPRDLARFNLLMDSMSIWRNEDHEDAMWITRNQVIEIIEGVKELRLITERILRRQNMSNRAEA